MRRLLLFVALAIFAGAANATQYLPLTTTTFFAGALSNTANAYSITTTPGGWALTAGYTIKGFVSAVNTAAATLAVNGGSALPIVNTSFAALTGGEMSPVAIPDEFVYSTSASGSCASSCYILVTVPPASIVPGGTHTITQAEWAAASVLQPTSAGQIYTLPSSGSTALSLQGGLLISASQFGVTLTASGSDTITSNGATTAAAGSILIPVGSFAVVTQSASGAWQVSGTTATILSDFPITNLMGAGTYTITSSPTSGFNINTSTAQASCIRPEVTGVTLMFPQAPGVAGSAPFNTCYDGIHPYSVETAAADYMIGCPSGNSQLLINVTYSAKLTPAADGQWYVCSGPGSNSSNGSIITASPTAPASTSAYEMQGLSSGAAVVTPSSTGSVDMKISGTLVAAAATVDDGVIYQICYGAGTGPANAASAIGTCVGTPQEFTNPVAPTAAGDVHQPFAIEALVTGLAIGTPIWIDLQAKSITTANDVGFSNVIVIGLETR